jgi:hypothetical protein
VSDKKVTEAILMGRGRWGSYIRPLALLEINQKLKRYSHVIRGVVTIDWMLDLLIPIFSAILAELNS